MPQAIEDYALIGDCRTAALVSRDGSIDWLCLPRFDSASVFGALLGDADHGRWLVRPVDADASSTRSYRNDDFTLVTRWETADGAIDVIDCMPKGDGRADLVRRVIGVRGRVEVEQELRIRFGYADALPWVRQIHHGDSRHLLAVAGPDAVVVRGPELSADDHRHTGRFTVGEGETVDLSMTWFPSYLPTPGPVDLTRALDATSEWWDRWAAPLDHDGPYHREVLRSLLVLRALTHEQTGGIVAAATTSLPEQPGGQRNWDYRYVWLRDASLTLEVLLSHGYRAEASEWRTWLLRALAGDPGDVQIMYGLAGERDLFEREIPSLPGHRGAAPVRVGNGAVDQYQADVIGEVMVALHEARKTGVEETEFSWPLQRALLSFVEENWSRPDNGIWEIRGPARHFTHSRVMTWAALDRAISAVRDHGLDGPVERWERLRDTLRTEIEDQGFDPDRNTFVQSYGSTEVDASLLQLPQVGFCAPDDPRMLGTVAALESDLLTNGLLQRYRTESGVDGLPAGEGAFLACSFWLAEQYARSGRRDDATTLMDRLVAYSNDVGLLSEEVDPATGAHLGNTPQALSHLALVRAADAIAGSTAAGSPLSRSRS